MEENKWSTSAWLHPSFRRHLMTCADMTCAPDDMCCNSCGFCNHWQKNKRKKRFNELSSD